MDFSDAIKSIINSKKVARKSWKDKRIYCLLKEELLQIHKAGEKEDETHVWIVNEWDMIADDWYEL